MTGNKISLQRRQFEAFRNEVREEHEETNKKLDTLTSSKSNLKSRSKRNDQFGVNIRKMEKVHTRKHEMSNFIRLKMNTARTVYQGETD